MGRNHIYIDIVDVALLCRLDIKWDTMESDEVQAKCPYCGDYKYRLYMSRKADNATFWCHNCGTGGNAVTLYADFNPGMKRLSTKEAFLELLRLPNVHCHESFTEYATSKTERIRPVHERSQIYLEMLSLLPLEDKHYQNLKSRGLSDEMIRGNMYKSLPTSSKDRKRIISHLTAHFDLSDMPGFYTKELQWQMACCQHSGFFIPVCDRYNQIQGLQIRLDEGPPKIVTYPDGRRVKKKGDRFRWLSTRGSFYQNGTGISSYIHIVGDQNCDTLRITEGPLKADIASYLSGGELFLGLTGVQNLKHLGEIVAQLNPKRILECIDMDVRCNPDVQRAQAKIQSICMPLCEEYRTFTWPPNQKGIDDWLLFEKLKRERGYFAA